MISASPTSVSPASSACATDHCITCGDDGVAMVVLRVDARSGLALCADGDGARSTVETALIESPAPGGRVLVHAGTAIASLPALEQERSA